MPSVLLAVGTSALPSADVVLADGATTTLVAEATGGPYSVVVEFATNTGYQPRGYLEPHASSFQATGPCTLRVRRVACGNPVGVSRD